MNLKRTFNDWPWSLEFLAEDNTPIIQPIDIDPYRIIGESKTITYTLKVFYEGDQVFACTNDRDSEFGLFMFSPIGDKFPLEKLMDDANTQMKNQSIQQLPQYPMPKVGDHFNYTQYNRLSGKPEATYDMEIVSVDPETHTFVMKAVSVTRETKENL